MLDDDGNVLDLESATERYTSCVFCKRCDFAHQQIRPSVTVLQDLNAEKPCRQPSREYICKLLPDDHASQERHGQGQGTCGDRTRCGGGLQTAAVCSERWGSLRPQPEPMMLVAVNAIPDACSEYSWPRKYFRSVQVLSESRPASSQELKPPSRSLLLSASACCLNSHACLV
jgi:hypothetical protein